MTFHDPDSKLGNYVLSTNNPTLTINPAPLSIVADDASRAYGQVDPIFTAQINGFVNGEDTNVLSGTLSITTDATASSPIGQYAIVPDGLSSTNYSISYTNGTLTITPYDLSVTADSTSRPYGGSNPTFTGNLLGVQNGDSIVATYTTDATPQSHVGNYDIVPQLTGDAQTNYTVHATNGTLTITRVGLLVVADNTNRLYGATNPVFTGTITGISNNDDIVVTYTTDATTNSPIGDYDIVPQVGNGSLGGVRRPNLGALDNYNVTLINGILTITPTPLSIVADDASRAYGQVDPIFTAQINGFVNGEDTNVLSGTLSITTDATASSLKEDYDIVPTGYSSTNYSISYTNGTLTVTAQQLFVNIDNASKFYGEDNPPFTGKLVGLQNGDSITATYGSAATAASGVGNYQIYPSLTDSGSKLGNYSVITNYGRLTIKPETLFGWADDKTRVYGDDNPTFTVQYYGFVNGETESVLLGTLVGVTPATTNSPVGDYEITVSGQTAANLSDVLYRWNVDGDSSRNFNSSYLFN